MEGRYNLRSPAVKRLMKEAQELAEPTEQYHAQPLEDNLFEWHFTIRGPSDSDFSGGVYHGRIILPPDYPMKPPSIMFLTQNGRFECFTKICLSISKHHPESWQPSWSIRTALLAIIGFMPSPGHGAIGSLDYTKPERVKLAKRSLSYTCEQCGTTADKVLPLTAKSEVTSEEIRNLGAQLSMTAEKSKAANSQPPSASGEQPIKAEQDDSVSPAAQPSEQPPLVSTPNTSTPELRQRTTTASEQSTTPVTEPTRPTPAPRPSTSTTLRPTTSTTGSQGQGQQSSRSCADSVTFWSLVVIGLVLGMLIIRRMLRTRLITDMLGEDGDL